MSPGMEYCLGLKSVVDKAVAGKPSWRACIAVASIVPLVVCSRLAEYTGLERVNIHRCTL